jgi:hypothetical protein
MMTAFTILIGLSACHAGFGIGSNGDHPAYAAATATESAEAQASMTTDLPPSE